jgi:manganese-dependent ADP-ribose/CDP-alcohol diphosphatase
LSREELSTKLQIPFTLESTGDLVGYFTHHINSNDQSENNNANVIESKRNKLRFLVLDSYDICVLDRCPQHSNKHHLARETLSANNPNYPHNENSPEGLEGLGKRFVAFGGGIDKPQLEWFESSLQSAKENGELVIVVSHQPIHPQSSWPTCLMWNYSEVLDIMRRNSQVIIASFSGHAHKGGYVRDEESGIHFRTLEAVLESPDPIRTYGIVDVWRDRLVFRGSGDCVSDVYHLDHLSDGDDDDTLLEQSFCRVSM